MEKQFSALKKAKILILLINKLFLNYQLNFVVANKYLLKNLLSHYFFPRTTETDFVCNTLSFIAKTIFIFNQGFFFFLLLATRGRHSATVFSISLDLLRLLPWLQSFPCLLSPNPSTFSLAFLFFFCLTPSSPPSFFPRSLLLSFLRVHTSVALHSEVCLPALQ